ncbi:hypothetical protein [Streptomyces armeniacus]|uniref:hypothetical protein n=1 Tax=Streptomyces armeniacus TaxID=83291 RepID=UPI001AD826FF|nr:hypothetical protein [Streptomyces armeniacus]
MGIRKGHRAVLIGAAAVGLIAAGYGSAVGVTADPSGDGARNSGPAAGSGEHRTAAADGEFESTIKLEDGRQVNVRLVEGTGVQERHRAEGADTWSKWQTIYKTESDRCQGVELTESSGTVSLVADFGRYCYDGEPPTESVAGVGLGDLAGSDWEINITKDFDGWQDASVSDDGGHVVFVRNSDAGLSTLRWEQGKGFGEIVRP